MEDKKIWLSPPHMCGEEINFIQKAIESNWVTQGGPFVDSFEQQIEKYLGYNIFAAALTSGTAAIHLGLSILGVEKGDFVICQSLTFVATANPIIYLGATPIFVDSEPDTWNLCPNAVEDAVKFCISKGKKPKAIIAVSLYGMPYKVAEISEISKKYDVPVLEDSAEALGSTYKGRKMGTFGELSVISFNGNKIITTSGGGALLVKNLELKKKALYLSTQAKDKAPHYQHSELGFNYRMSNIAASIGCAQVEVLENRVSRRRYNHNHYKIFFEGIEGINLLEEPSDDYFSNHWLSVITVEPQLLNNLNREEMRVKLLKNNIESRPLWKPMHLQPVFKNEYFFGGNIAEELFLKGLCLPSGSNLSNDDLGRITNVIADVFYEKI